MNIRSPLGVALAALIVVVGFAIGGWLAIATRPNQTQTVSMSTHNAAPTPTRAKAPLPTATRIVASARTETPLPIQTSTPTATPAAVPSAIPTVVPTAVPTVPATVQAAITTSTQAQGSWQIAEANVHVGTIVWAGSASPRGNTIVLDVRKESVGGRPAVPCERQTNLHAAFTVGVAQQTVPFQEVNCQGVASSGEVRVTQFSPDGRAFSGTFWQDGSKLGDFDARQR